MNNTRDTAEGSAAPTGYTPGPWTLDGPTGFADPSQGSAVYAPYGNGHLVAMIENRYAPTQPGNARLIAAAPKLYETCRHLLWLIEVELQADGGHICDDARKLIESIGV